MLRKHFYKILRLMNVVFNYTLNRFMWFIYCIIPRTIVIRNINHHKIQLDAKFTIMFVPHADDELLGAGGYLSKNPGTKLVYCGFTGENQTLENASIRRKEYEKYCAGLQLNSIDLTDSKKVDELLRKAEYVFLPTIIDWHDEHRYINWRVLELCDKLGARPNIVWYSISVPIITFLNVYYQPLDKKELKDKYKTFKNLYISQKNIPIMRFMLRDRMNGFECESCGAEKFLILDYLEWKQNLKKFSVLEIDNKVKQIKKNVNSIKTLYKDSEKSYKKLLFYSD